jgi:hypothetical protein
VKGREVLFHRKRVEKLGRLQQLNPEVSMIITRDLCNFVLPLRNHGSLHDEKSV